MARRRRSRSVDTPEPVSIRYVGIGCVIPYDSNPRDNREAVESVANSIQSFGFLVPIVVDEDMVVIAGHTRLEAANSLGLKEVPVIVAGDLTEDQVKQFRLIDNKVSELARWDFDLLSEEITSLQDSGIDFTQFGWTQEEVDCLTDVVADDCLSGADILPDESPEHDMTAPRGPSTTRFVFGEFVFFVPSDAYRRWANQLRSDMDYNEQDMIQEIKERLSIEE